MHATRPVSVAAALLVGAMAAAPAAPTGPAPAGAASPRLDTAHIERLTGVPGQLDERSGVYKVSVPRSDFSLSVAGVRVTPPMGLTSWVAFQQVGGHAVAMGDLVLLQDQVNPVMSAALDHGLEVTALHNHFFWDQPRVMFMHVGGAGETAALAGAVGQVFAEMRATAGGRGDPPLADVDPARTSLDPARIESILHAKGSLADGVYKVVLGRTTDMHGHPMGAAMGVNTWAAFAGSNEKAVVDGDFAMREDELQGVLKALRASRIDVVAIHQHMIDETPRILFLHYWAIGRTEDLARGLRAALDRTATGREATR